MPERGRRVTWRFHVRRPSGWAPLPDTLTGDLASARARCAELEEREGEPVDAEQEDDHDDALRQQGRNVRPALRG